MNVVKISPEAWATLQEIQSRKNHHAYCLGVAQAEFLRERSKLLDVADGGPDMLRFGALHWERDQREAFFWGKIREGDEDQKRAGEAALRRAGIDTDSDEYTIEGGIVFRLSNGAWLPLEREE